MISSFYKGNLYSRMSFCDEIELLAPARTADIGIAAINCGADAVYIGAERFGARAAAGNSVQDIARLSAYAHRFKAKVFVTVNTLLTDAELHELTYTHGNRYNFDSTGLPNRATESIQYRLNYATLTVKEE